LDNLAKYFLLFRDIGQRRKIIEIDLKKWNNMMQKYFIDSWLSPCSLRSHRTTNPTPKNGFAIFRLCPPTTQIQADTRKQLSVQEFFVGYVIQCVKNLIFQNFSYICVWIK